MLICLCKAVSDKTIRGLVQNGASCVRDVMIQCRAGSDCGTCVAQLKELIEQARQECEGQGPAAGRDTAANE